MSDTATPACPESATAAFGHRGNVVTFRRAIRTCAFCGQHDALATESTATPGACICDECLGYAKARLTAPLPSA